MRFGVSEDALKRPEWISYSDVLHVVRTGDYLGPIQKGKMWWIGTTPSGLDIEVVGAVSHNGDAVILIHAFPMIWRKR